MNGEAGGPDSGWGTKVRQAMNGEANCEMHLSSLNLCISGISGMLAKASNVAGMVVR